MTEKVKVLAVDPHLEKYISSLHKASDHPTLQEAVLAATDEEVASTRRDGEAAVLFNRLRNKLPDLKLGRFGDAGYLMPLSYKEDADNMRSMAVRPDDVWVVTFPRSGTTWTLELVWLLHNELDYDTALKTELGVRSIFPEFMHIISSATINKEELDQELENAAKLIPSFEAIANTPSSRVFKTHLPFSLLPASLLDTAKVVYVARDPRDVAVSFYHFDKRFYNFEGDFKTYWKLFVDDLVIYTPFFPRLEEAWALRDHPNMLFIFYENMIKNLPSCIKRIATFYGKQLTNEQIDKLCEHLDIQNFRKNPSVNPYEKIGNLDVDGFVRKGKVGAWREYFEAEMAAQAQQWMRGNLTDCDLHFPDHSS